MNNSADIQESIPTKSILDTLRSAALFSSPWHRMAFGSIAVGIIIRLWQYLSNPSIWVDEAAIARNILDRHPWQLFGPLDYGQIAPRGFLLSVKLASALFGPSEYSLRLVPFLWSVASLILFFIIASFVLRPVNVFIATSMAALAIPLIFFSSNLKQYSSDIAITLLILWMMFYLQTYQLDRRATRGFAFAALPLLFFSQVAVFPLTVAGGILAADAWIGRRADRWNRLAIALVWAIAVIVTTAYNSWAMIAADRMYAYRFWEGSFPPSQGTWSWIWTTFQNLFAKRLSSSYFDGAFHYSLPAFFAGLAIVGAVILCIEFPVAGLMLAGPFLVVLIAAVFHQFPFGTRLSLFLIPELILLIVAGAEKISDVLSKVIPSRYMTLVLVPFALAAFLNEPPPYQIEHIRPVLYYMKAHWQKGDTLWVYYGAGQAFHYYKKLIPFDGAVYTGECNRAKPRSYLRQLDVVREHERVWILLAHGSGRFQFDERKLITDYLDTIGTRLDQFHAPIEDTSNVRAEVFLYDLSDPQKLASSSAEKFMFTNPYPSVLWACYSTMSPLEANHAVINDLMQYENP